MSATGIYLGRWSPPALIPIAGLLKDPAQVVYVGKVAKLSGSSNDCLTFSEVLASATGDLALLASSSV